MSEQIIKTNAAIELSEQELEVVAGGGIDPQALLAKQHTNFDQRNLDVLKASQSGPHGSSTKDIVSADALNTAASDLLKVANSW